MKITKAIIPAAGFGTRFLPATKSQPKEMLPIVDKPAIHYIVEEAVNSGIKEIIIITSRGKHSIEDYFDHSSELFAHLAKKGKTEFIKDLQRIESMAKFIYIRQPHPKGDGDAILQAQDIVKNEPFAVLFGDDIYDSNPPALKQMMDIYEQTNSPIIALTKIDKSQSFNYGMIKSKPTTSTLHEITDFVEKPAPENSPSDLAVTGKYIVTPELLNDLKSVAESKESNSNNEILLIDGMCKYVQKSPIYGLEIQGDRFDTGSKIGYLKAVTHFALKDPELREDYKKHLQGLDLNSK
ncbi:UTP--glucose-1-phosphate uridylyltransferase [Candidatus Peregrinibacteria bacterium HGW-Peregrinibacteria-1]|jgi:UTP--glucose-1-phosphate uridylyltransferase|nr:MAG: UTP--glucose-1-phosphate uridylyltransferase [Candidatus Peregrinibacteria bacterium HGW-Peregrinibacteria-1]